MRLFTLLLQVGQRRPNASMMTCMTTTEVYLKTLLFCSFYVDLYQCVKYDLFCFHPCIRSLSFQKSYFNYATSKGDITIIRSQKRNTRTVELQFHNVLCRSSLKLKVDFYGQGESEKQKYCHINFERQNRESTDVCI